MLNLLLVMLTIVVRFPTYFKIFLVSFLQIEAMFLTHLANQLLEDFGIQFFGLPRRNMKNKLMRLHDKLLSRQRSIIETINDQLKNISQIEHSRHRSRQRRASRSPINFCVNVLCGLIAYCHQPKKPSLRLDWLLPQSAKARTQV